MKNRSNGKWRLIPAFVLLLLSCSFVTAKRFPLPADVSMNKDAGRGGAIIITVRLKNGEALPMLLDTGSPVTILDKSLEPQLGKCLGSATLWNFGDEAVAKIYKAPALYLANTPLAQARHVVALDCSALSYISSEPIKGVLGTDILRFYCIQLDFATNKIRFLDYDSDKTGWGKPFRLYNTRELGGFMIKANLAGFKHTGSFIDTGCNYDGWLMPKMFQQWTNQSSRSANGEIHSPNAILGGDIYNDVGLSGLSASALSGSPHLSGIGLRFLSRHLVTLDFPQKTLYLSRRSENPLPFDNDADTPLIFLRRLKEKGQLPGWSKDEHGVVLQGFVLGSLGFKKSGDSSIYHYTVSRTSENGPWKLVKAWRTDQNGRITVNYSVP
jgi:hypothetical protein